MKSGWVGGITINPEETINLGRSLSKFIESGDIITLDGKLAAGKTTFVKGILEGFEYPKDVTSPTFTLINEYEAQKRIVHIDCYRESNLNRWISLGIQDYLHSSDIKLIEWPEIIKKILPDGIITISINSISESKREIYIR